MRVRSEPSLERSKKEASVRSEYLKEQFRKRSVALPGPWTWKRAEEPSVEQSLVLSPSRAVQADCHP
jgi:hypothetical protein